jgi:prepilin-type N-terminal cleavage/methylation domain-containing protein
MKRCNKKYIKQSSLGFTLIELMTSIAIIGILAAISIPNYLSYRQKAEFAALQHTLQFLMDAQDIYFVENNTFYPDNDSININPGRARSMPELNYAFGPNHRHRFKIQGRNRTDGRGRQINSYWIEVRTDYDFDGNGKKDRIRFTTLFLDGELISQRAFRQYR